MFSRQASWKRRRRTTFRPPDRPDCHSPPHRPHSAQRTRPATGVRAELQRRRRHQHSFMEAESTPERIICVQPPAQPVALASRPDSAWLVRDSSAQTYTWDLVVAEHRRYGSGRGIKTPGRVEQATSEHQHCPPPAWTTPPPAAPGRVPTHNPPPPPPPPQAPSAPEYPRKRSSRGPSLILLGLLAWQDGEVTAAARFGGRKHRGGGRRRGQWNVARALQLLGWAAATTGWPEQAAMLFGGSQSLLDSIQDDSDLARLPPPRDAENQARLALGEAGYSQWFAEGYSLSAADAVRYALDVGTRRPRTLRSAGDRCL